MEEKAKVGVTTAARPRGPGRPKTPEQRALAAAEHRVGQAGIVLDNERAALAARQERVTAAETEMLAAIEALEAVKTAQAEAEAAKAAGAAEGTE